MNALLLIVAIGAAFANPEAVMIGGDLSTSGIASNTATFFKAPDGHEYVSTPCPDGIEGCCVLHQKLVPINTARFEVAELTALPLINQAVVGQAVVAFKNPEAVEQACDNKPATVRAAIEANCDQTTVDAIEAAIVPTPTLDQQSVDLKTALALVKRVSADASKDPAVLALETKITALEATKPVEPIEEPIVIKK